MENLLSLMQAKKYLRKWGLGRKTGVIEYTQTKKPY